ncbi:pre-rRNA-processing protein ESF2-like [Vicia villosa]|uniref:pre-rRNA-processing protein ESF2-like n=1 Tax=Vicia villosa TaxID=3911 RepID=UPI00273B2843|nr:pre-rRNA-processing protein ESF2-like [Vicia villosa]
MQKVEVGDEGPLGDEIRDEEVEEVVMEEVRTEGVRDEGVRDEGVRDEADNEGVRDKADNEGVRDDADNEGVRDDADNQDGYVSEEDEDYVASDEESEDDSYIGVDGAEWDWTSEIPVGGGSMNETQTIDEESDQDESNLHTPVESDDEIVQKKEFSYFQSS